MDSELLRPPAWHFLSPAPVQLCPGLFTVHPMLSRINHSRLVPFPAEADTAPGSMVLLRQRTGTYR